MYQMNFIDSNFWNSRNTFMHIMGGTFLFQNKNNTDFKKTIINNFNKSINNSILIKAVVADSAIKNDYPYLVPCKDFNIEDHIIEHHLSTEENIETLIEELINKDFDPTKPAWMIHLIHHNDKDNHITFFRTTHHAFADANTYSKNCWDAAFDNVIIRGKIKKKKINKFNCYINHYKKILHSKLVYLKGYLFDASYTSNKDQTIRKQLFIGTWKPRGSYNRAFHKFTYDLCEVESSLKKHEISSLIFSFVANSIVYRQILSSKNLNNKTILTLYPIPSKTNKKLQNTNQIIPSVVNLHVNETDTLKLIDLIKNEINTNSNVIKNTPFNAYARSARLDPRISKAQYSWDLLNKASWKNEKRKPKIINDSGYVATTTSFYGDGGFSDICIGGNRLVESHLASLPLAVPGSIGISSSFRKMGKNLHVSINYLEQLAPSKNELEKMYISAFEQIIKAINGSNR